MTDSVEKVWGQDSRAMFGRANVEARINDSSCESFLNHCCVQEAPK